MLIYAGFASILLSAAIAKKAVSAEQLGSSWPLLVNSERFRFDDVFSISAVSAPGGLGSEP